MNRLHALMAMLAVACVALSARAQTTAFSYQGKLVQNGQPATGTFDMKLGLFDDAVAGNQLTTLACFEDVQVTDGLFTLVVPLALPSSGADTYLEIRVRPGALGTCAIAGGYTTLGPRQRITPAPIATLAMGVTGNPPALKGAIRLNPANGRFEGYNGAYWAPFTMGTPLAPASVQEYPTPGAYQFVVPPGVTSLGVDVWSGGGGGGGPPTTASASTCLDPPGGCGGGGGGAGAYARVVIDVTPGETLLINVGDGGAAGAQSTDGGNGAASSVFRAGTPVVRALGGQGGGHGLNIVGTLGLPAPCNSINNGLVPGGDGGAVTASVGIVIASTDGEQGSAGQGARCNTNNGSFCPAVGGGGGASAPAPAPLAAAGASNGGTGASPGGAASPGGGGRVRLFWN